MKTRQSIICTWATLALIGVAGHGALAQSLAYPRDHVRFIVPFTAGGGVDLMARTLGTKLSESFGKQFVIDNRGGASGMIGTQAVAKAARDGYTLLLTGASFVTSPVLYKESTYDPFKDFDPISLIAIAPNALVVHPSLPVRSVMELIALAKARPGQILYASGGAGTTPHLAAELFKMMTNTDLVHVPYRGTGPTIVALLSGEVSVMFMNMLQATPYIKSRRVRSLAVTSTQRLPSMPELPTVAETGLRNYQSAQWYGLLAPAGTPDGILNLLNSHIAKVMHAPEMAQRMTDAGSLAVGGTREEFASYLKDETARWTKVIKQSGARVD